MTRAIVQMYDEPSGIYGRTMHVIVKPNGKLAVGTIYQKTGDDLTESQVQELLKLFEGTPHRLNFYQPEFPLS